MKSLCVPGTKIPRCCRENLRTDFQSGVSTSFLSKQTFCWLDSHRLKMTPSHQNGILAQTRLLKSNCGMYQQQSFFDDTESFCQIMENNMKVVLVSAHLERPKWIALKSSWALCPKWREPKCWMRFYLSPSNNVFLSNCSDDDVFSLARVIVDKEKLCALCRRCFFSMKLKKEWNTDEDVCFHNRFLLRPAAKSQSSLSRKLENCSFIFCWAPQLSIWSINHGVWSVFETLCFAAEWFKDSFWQLWIFWGNGND